MSNNIPPPNPAQEIHIFEETSGVDHWEHRGCNLNLLQQKPDSNFVVFASARFKELNEYKYRKANSVHGKYFHEDFARVVEDDINGSFHCDYTIVDDIVSPTVSWTCFKIKLVYTAVDYKWKQPTVYVDWSPKTKRQLVFLVDFLGKNKQKDFLASLPARSDRDKNPYFWHTAFTRNVLEQYDKAFWMLRDQVRILEKIRSNPSHPPPNFPLLHDIARHVFHFVETIEVAEHTLQSLVAEQMRWRKEEGDAIKKILNLWLKTHRQLLFQEKGIHSLKTRARSLNDRHLNEINLAFNLVSQGFGRNAQSDSAIMKTIGVVSMVYLPGTFVSGLFGTNFFDFNASSSDVWTTSSDFWVYWAVTVPLTLLTVLIWVFWHWREVLMKWFGKITLKSPTTGQRVDTGGLPMGILNRVRTGTSSLLLRKEPQRQETV